MKPVRCHHKLVMYFAANYILAFLTIDRVLALWVPVNYKMYGKSSIAVGTTILVECVSAFVCIPVLTIYDLHEDECSMIGKDILTENQRHAYVIWIVLVGLIGVPFLSILTSNILIVYKLRRMEGKVSRKEREITISLVLVSICFLVMNLGIGSVLITTAGVKIDTYRQYLFNKLLNVFAVSLDSIQVGKRFSEKNTIWKMSAA